MSRNHSVETRALSNTGLQPGGCAIRAVSAVSTAFGRVTLGSEEMQRDVPFIANDPAVMRHRRYVKQIACTKLNHAAVVEGDCRGSRENKPDMFNGATSGPHTWPDVL